MSTNALDIVEFSDNENIIMFKKKKGSLTMAECNQCMMFFKELKIRNPDTCAKCNK